MVPGRSDQQRLAVIAMGASAGGVDALTTVVAGLPSTLPAAVLIVLHVSPRGISVLPHILDKRCALPVSHATDGDALEAGRVYVAPPDVHLLVTRGRVHLSDGPRENGVRPAIDVLFRSAAYAYGSNVIGVVLSGTLDDGTAGLIAIKQRGGVGVVQDPAEAVFPGMPLSAARFADPDHIVPLDKLAQLLTGLVGGENDAQRRTASSVTGTFSNRGTDMAQTDHSDDRSADSQPGDPSEFTCPDCGGTLWEYEEGHIIRFRCRVGHAYSTESLLAEQKDALESALWAAVVALEERADLSLRLARRMQERGHRSGAARFDREVSDARRRAALVREAIARLSLPLSGAELGADA